MHLDSRGEHAPDPAGTGLISVGDGCMWIDDSFRSLLDSDGRNRFQSIMDTLDGDCMRALKDRENWRLRLNGQTVYLKKHHIRTWSSRLRAKLRLGPSETAARTEARNVRHLARDGVDAMTLIAFGERLSDDGLLESFLLTEDLHGYVQLDHFIAERFPQRELHRTLPRQQDVARDMKTLIDEVARVARRFHQSGYNHRDLYCCHFFIKEPEPGRFLVRLIDLQRVQHRRRFRRRWIVKDLAQLAYSAPRERVKCTHKIAFVRAYLGVKKLRPRDKRLIRAVLAKQQLMERKQGIIP
jgi:heptose I phosphotransferase